MQIFRPLTLSLLIALSPQLIAPLTAQSSKRSPSSFPVGPTLSDTRPNSDSLQLLPPIDMRGISLSPQIPAAENENVSQEIISKEDAVRRVLAWGENKQTCLTLRTYRVARDSPDSDSTQPAGYTTCVPFTRFQLKTAVETREITPQ